MSGKTASFLLIFVFAVWLMVLTTARSQRVVASQIVKSAESTVASAAAKGALSSRVLRGLLRMAEQAERLDPLSADAVILHAGLVFLMGNPALSAEHYRRSLVLEQRSEAFFNLGRCYRELGQLELATENFENAVRLDGRRYRSLRNAVSVEFREQMKQRRATQSRKR